MPKWGDADPQAHLTPPQTPMQRLTGDLQLGRMYCTLYEKGSTQRIHKLQKPLYIVSLGVQNWLPVMKLQNGC